MGQENDHLEPSEGLPLDISHDSIPPEPRSLEAPPPPPAAPALPTRVLAWSGETMGEALSLLHGVSIQEGQLIDRIADQLFGELGNLLRPRMARAQLEEGGPGLARERAAQAQVIALWLRSFAMEEGVVMVNTPVPNIVGRTSVALAMACRNYELQQAMSARERLAAQAELTPIGIAPAGEPVKGDG
jgi:hypothetical protein